MSENTEIAAWVAAVALPTLTLILGWYLKYRKDRREDRKQERQGDLQEESVAIEVYRKVVEQLTARVDALESQIREMQKAHTEGLAQAHAVHLECVKDKEQMRGELNVMREQLDRLRAHDERNAEQVKENLKGIQKLEAKIEGKTP